MKRKRGAAHRSKAVPTSAALDGGQQDQPLPGRLPHRPWGSLLACAAAGLCEAWKPLSPRSLSLLTEPQQAMLARAWGFEEWPFEGSQCRG